MHRAGLEVVTVQYFGLALEVLGEKVLGVLNKRLFGPVLQAIYRNGADRSLRAKQFCGYFLRYRAGAFIPHIGPQTLLVVAKPTTRKPTNVR
jgi:hypothetical protein